MHQWANFNVSKLHSWYYDMFSFKLMICCYYVAFTLQLFFPTPTLKASGLVLIHVWSSVYVFFFLIMSIELCCVYWHMLYMFFCDFSTMCHLYLGILDGGNESSHLVVWVKVNESVWIIVLLNCNYLNEIKYLCLNTSLNEVECNLYPLSEVDILDNLQFWVFKNI
jgi:hypothetical protein